MKPLSINKMECFTVIEEELNTYLRLTSGLSYGATANVWYVATRSGWDLLPDSAADNLESRFQDAQPKGTIQ